MNADDEGEGLPEVHEAPLVIDVEFTEVEEETGISPTPLNEIELPQDGPYG